MSSLKVVISTPVDDNLYSLLVTKMCIDEPGVQVVGVFSLKVWSISRLKVEFKRLRKSILSKIWLKFFVPKNQSNNEVSNKIENDLRHKYELTHSSLKSLCGANNISFIKTDGPNSKETISFVTKLEPEIILSIGSVILKDEFIGLPKKGVLNVHMGILPEYRGIGVTEWPILDSDSLETINVGVTLHFIERGVDTGPILLKKTISLKGLKDINDLESKYPPLMVDAMHEGIKMIRDNKQSQMIQSSSEGKQFFYLHNRLKEKAENKLKVLLKNDS